MVAVMDRRLCAEEVGVVQDMEERDLAAAWAAPATGNAMDKDRPPGFPPPHIPHTLSLYFINETDGNNAKTNTPQTDTTTNTDGIWTTIRKKRTTRQADGRDNKSSDTGKLTLVANKYACLIKEDQTESNRENINVCKALLRILHPQYVRKMISVKHARHPTSKLEKEKIEFKLPRIQKRRKINPVKNTEYPTSALDKMKIGDKQTRLEKRNESWLQKKEGEMNFVYNNKVPIPHPSQLTAGFSRVSHKQTHPITTLSDFHHGSTQHSKKKQREKRKREHDAKDGKHQKKENLRGKNNQTQTEDTGKVLKK